MDGVNLCSIATQKDGILIKLHPQVIIFSPLKQIELLLIMPPKTTEDYSFCTLQTMINSNGIKQ